MRILPALIAATLLGFVVEVHAQERKDSSGPAVYKVEFDISDGSDGATEPSQHFSMLVDDSRKGVFQATNPVRVATSSFQNIDVGVKIECTVHESAGKASLRADIELTSIAGQVDLSGVSQPIVGTRKMAFEGTVELSSPTVIIRRRNALAANPVSLNRMDSPASAILAKPPAIAAMNQVQATVTKVN